MLFLEEGKTENVEKVSDRQLAKYLGVSEEDARQKRRKRGFLKLEDFQDQEEAEESLDIDAELGKWRRGLRESL
jgi:hypothetical protein